MNIGDKVIVNGSIPYRNGGKYSGVKGIIVGIRELYAGAGSVTRRLKPLIACEVGLEGMGVVEFYEYDLSPFEEPALEVNDDTLVEWLNSYV